MSKRKRKTAAQRRGAELRSQRQTAGLSVAQFATEMCVYWNTVYRWERGEVNMRPAMRALADRVLKVRPPPGRKRAKKRAPRR